MVLLVKKHANNPVDPCDAFCSDLISPCVTYSEAWRNTSENDVTAASQAMSEQPKKKQNTAENGDVR